MKKLLIKTNFFSKEIHLVLLLLLISFFFSFKNAPRPRVLVFSKTTYYYHTSIANGNVAIKKLGTQNGFDVDTTTNAAWFNKKQLHKYAAIIFLSTTDSSDILLNARQKAAFEDYIKKGGGYVGIHAASDAGYQWPWYGKLVGGYFNGHPDKHQLAVLNVINQSHPATRNLPKKWSRTDEWYNFKDLNKNVKVLITIDETSYEGGTNGAFHPVAWYHDYDGGRAFYTALGHTEESFTEPEYLKHLLGGIQYAMGVKK